MRRRWLIAVLAVVITFDIYATMLAVRSIRVVRALPESEAEPGHAWMSLAVSGAALGLEIVLTLAIGRRVRELVIHRDAGRQ